MGFVSGDKELSASSNRAFQNAVVIVVSGDNSNPLGWMDQMGHSADRPETLSDILSTKAKLVPQDPLKFQDYRRRQVQIHFPPARASQDLVGLASRKGQCRDQDIGVEDDPHEALLADLMNESIHVLLGSDAENLSPEGSLALKFSPLPLLEIEAQGLSDELTPRAALRLGRPFGLSDEFGRKRDGPRPGDPHLATSCYGYLTK